MTSCLGVTSWSSSSIRTTLGWAGHCCRSLFVQWAEILTMHDIQVHDFPSWNIVLKLSNCLWSWGEDGRPSTRHVLKCLPREDYKQQMAQGFWDRWFRHKWTDWFPISVGEFVRKLSRSTHITLSHPLEFPYDCVDRRRLSCSRNSRNIYYIQSLQFITKEKEYRLTNTTSAAFLE